jgi:hypothetical protein
MQLYAWRVNAVLSGCATKGADRKDELKYEQCVSDGVATAALVGIELRLLYDIVARFTVDYYSSDNVREKTRIGGDLGGYTQETILF